MSCWVSVDVDVVQIGGGGVEVDFPERRKWERRGGEEHESQLLGRSGR